MRVRISVLIVFGIVFMLAAGVVAWLAASPAVFAISALVLLLAYVVAFVVLSVGKEPR